MGEEEEEGGFDGKEKKLKVEEVFKRPHKQRLFIHILRRSLSSMPSETSGRQGEILVVGQRR